MRDSKSIDVQCMKAVKTLLGLFIIVLCSNLCLGQSSEYYCGLHIGDVVGQYFPKSAQVLLFADELTCWTCIKSINTFTPVLKKSKLKVALFRRGAESMESDTLPDMVEKVVDVVGAYHSYYHVKNSGVIVVIDRDGRVVFIGAPGKASFSVDAFVSAVRSATSAVQSMQSSAPSSKDVTFLKEFKTSVSVSFAPAIDYLDSQKVVAVLAQHNLLTIVDTMGREIRSKMLTGLKVGDFKISTPVLAGERMENGSPVLVMSDADPVSLDPYIIGYNIAKDSLFIIAKYKNAVGSDRYMAWINTYNDVRLNCGFSRMYDLADQRVDTLQPMLMYDYRKQNYKQFGNIDSFYLCSYLNSYSRISYAVNSNKSILAVYMLGRNLYAYDSTGQFQSCTKLYYDSTIWDYSWMKKAATFTSKTGIEDIMSLQKTVTMVTDSRLLLDCVSDELYIPLLHAHDSNNGKLQIDYYIHKVSLNGDQKTYTMPSNARPLYVNGGVICALTESGDKYTLQYYSLK